MKTYIICGVLCVALLVFFASVGYGQVIPQSGELPEYQVDRDGPVGAHEWQDNNDTPAYTYPGGPGGSAPHENRPSVSNGDNVCTVVPIRLGDLDLLFVQYIGK